MNTAAAGVFGAIEAGGTKFICGFGTGPEDLVTTEIPTGAPDATVAEAVAWLRAGSGGRLRAVGIGSFGPVDLGSGRIKATPKAGWQNFGLAAAVEDGLGVPVFLDTDVNAAALAEARWGAARGVSNCLYLTVGTGIGGGAIVNGRILHGLTHPEMGHVRIPHDAGADPYPGACPYHGDCLEGLASGPAIERRWGAAGQTLADDHPAWDLEAHYLALGIAGFVCTLSPEMILMGGGVMRRKQLYGKIAAEAARLVGGYVEKLPEIVAPALGEMSGVLGALVLAQTGAI